MPVVKAQQGSHLKQSAIVMDLSDLEKQAGQIIAQAKAEAAQLRAKTEADATLQAEQIRAAAREAGHAEGFAAGLEEGRQQGHDEAVVQAQGALQQLSARWTTVLDEMERNLPTHQADMKMDVVRLALAIAARVTKLEGLRGREAVKGNVAAALELVGAGRTVALRVNPNELEAVKKYVPELMEKLRTVPGIEVVGDPAVTHGGAVLRFGGGEVDARLETQVEKIAEELTAGGA